MKKMNDTLDDILNALTRVEKVVKKINDVVDVGSHSFLRSSMS